MTWLSTVSRFRGVLGLFGDELDTISDMILPSIWYPVSDVLGQRCCCTGVTPNLLRNFASDPSHDRPLTVLAEKVCQIFDGLPVILPPFLYHLLTGIPCIFWDPVVPENLYCHDIHGILQNRSCHVTDIVVEEACMWLKEKKGDELLSI